MIIQQKWSWVRKINKQEILNESDKFIPSSLESTKNIIENLDNEGIEEIHKLDKIQRLPAGWDRSFLGVLLIELFTPAKWVAAIGAIVGGIKDSKVGDEACIGGQNYFENPPEWASYMEESESML